MSGRWRGVEHEILELGTQHQRGAVRSVVQRAPVVVLKLDMVHVEVPVAAKVADSADVVPHGLSSNLRC